MTSAGAVHMSAFAFKLTWTLTSGRTCQHDRWHESFGIISPVIDKCRTSSGTTNVSPLLSGTVCTQVYDVNLTIQWRYSLTGGLDLRWYIYSLGVFINTFFVDVMSRYLQHNNDNSISFMFDDTVENKHRFVVEQNLYRCQKYYRCQYFICIFSLLFCLFFLH